MARPKLQQTKYSESLRLTGTNQQALKHHHTLKANSSLKYSKARSVIIQITVQLGQQQPGEENAEDPKKQSNMIPPYPVNQQKMSARVA